MNSDTLPDDPLWYRDAVIYELHVRAFYDSTGDGVGDFPGLTSKLDYLERLGVTCLWLLPFYPSPLKDDGYDIAHYEGVHPSYGTLRDFKAFLREAHERGMRVVTELVINHTSDQHPWFQAARRAPAGSSKRDYYVWSDTNRKYEGVRIIFTDTETSNWTWDDVARAYYWHRFFRHQPDLNFDNPRVRRAVMKTMKFWLDMGVDGLRLDAIPYLIEREGTICENLPETHDILRDIRREVDANYRNRMLLAEANQWPADVRAYFGEGNECHMAFHFPLMPRIFMALQQADRFPILEILRQTPDVPEACQWALFLRNHDELTLEMVTDEERDYMYKAYAADPQMRINIGIRRRLAPLMENDRQRIELGYGLLFSLPGTPVIYYGDEIGMGDNIYLGDRNGVRTPMQWTGDRNAGFSRADPARLFAPPIMDPVYGYQGLNVEAQERSPYSLLNWVKRMISLRRQHKVFGRGTIEFVEAANRRVLAYVRRLGDDTVLCVANLARTVQPVELQLEAFTGLVPVELRDRTEFPRIGRTPYFLSLAPYEFYWFHLQRAPEPAVSARTSAPAEPAWDRRPAVYAGPAWDTLFDGNIRHIVERDYLVPFLQRQRWFPGKARRPVSAKIVDWGVLARGEEPAFLTLVDVAYADGATDRFFLPMGTRAGEEGVKMEDEAPANAIARISGARKGVLHDLVDERLAALLLEAIEQQRDIRLRQGTVTGQPMGSFARIRGEAAARDLRARRLGGEQSNTSVIFGDRLILKLIRRVEPGTNPDYEITEHLSERLGFDRVPPLAGGLRYRSADGRDFTVGVLQGLIEHQANGWDAALDGMRRFYDRALATGRTAPPELLAPAPLVVQSDMPVPPGVADTLGVFVEYAGTLGRRTAELHAALARADGNPDFEPEPFSREARAVQAAGMAAMTTKTFELTAASSERLPERFRDLAANVLAARGSFLDAFAKIEAQDDAGEVIRVHGDYHLGQILWSMGDFYILDFEGEPMRPLRERRAKASPLKDVAGMLRSFSYAAYAGLFTYTRNNATESEILDSWAGVAERWSAGIFLKAYRDTLSGTPLLPRQPAGLEVLLRAYLLEKAAYELGYELNNRPDWVRIPLMGLLTLVGAAP